MINNIRHFGTLLHEKKYGIQGDRTEQKAEITLHVNRGRWELKDVEFQFGQNPYSRDDWKFLKELATYVEYLCRKVEKDKLEMDIPEKDMNVLSWWMLLSDYYKKGGK